MDVKPLILLRWYLQDALPNGVFFIYGFIVMQEELEEGGIMICLGHTDARSDPRS